MASVAFPNDSKTLTTSDGTKYGYINIVPKPSKPTLLFFHGYPSSSYHWHNQVKQCIASGYGAIAPDLLGYGDTDKPTEIAAYDGTLIAKHVIEILDAEKQDKVIGVGHDWGASQLAVNARIYPERFSKLIFLAVGYISSQEALQDIDAVNDMTTKVLGRPLFGYWKFHNDPAAPDLIAAAPADCLSTLFFPSDPQTWIQDLGAYGGEEAWIRGKKVGELASWVKQEELDTHLQILREGGFAGPLNWYRQAMSGVTHRSELKINPDYASTTFSTPTLFVGCTEDVVCVAAFQVAGMKDFFTDLTVKNIDTSHWCMIEKPEETWSIMEEWIEGHKFNL